MIDFYITRDKELVKLNEFENGAWINVVDPSAEEKALLIDRFNVDPTILEDALDPEESPRYEYEDEDTFIIINVPIKSKDDDEFYETIPLAIFHFKNYIITVCISEDTVLEKFLKGKTNKSKDFYTQYKTRFILQILQNTSNEYLRNLKILEKLSDRITTNVKDSIENKELLSLLKIEKSLVYFATSLRGNEKVLERLLRHHLIKNYPEDSDLLEDVITDNKQALEMTSLYTDILSSTMETYASIISNNQNDAMKILTSITFVMSIPTIVSGIWGMNVWVPMQDKPFGFLIIMAVIVLLTVLVAYLLRKLRML
ncbi:magnesium transporter CorA family protein [Fastidiosipila sanguinis]|uniref:Magnesium transporter n=1 Tax=Fastidiosipila sanguinis TaxID=236753 RepID=A0A2S0KML0_9FIRM|nr:magnesium transporter CorA family protein [Fastidiosipila sanguinis]AVM42272.1 magnesium transporter [Fastidiosipila sanguinis]